MRKFMLCVVATAVVALAQTAPSFEVATIKPAAPLDRVKMAAAVQAGQMPKIGPHVDRARAEYTFMALRDLIALAYAVKPYQITGPDWLASQRFDIVAKLPEGASKDDAPKMLQALLAERFKLAVHRDTQEHPVMALVVGKKGPKMKESPGAPEPIDENAPLKPGEMSTEGAEGPVRVTIGKSGGATVNMGVRGVMTYKMDLATQTLHMEGSKMTMAGFADMLARFSQMTGGGGRQVVDMTGLQGHYDVSLDFTLADMINMARSVGVEIPATAGAAAPAGNAPAAAASEPGGSSSLYAGVEALGLKLEKRKAMVDQLVIDHVEKTPTEN